MPVRMFVTAGTVHDVKYGEQLIKGINAEYLLGDKGYDSTPFIEKAESQGMITVIPPRSNRKDQRFYDNALYKLRHLVENAFLALKRWRGIATRYATNTASFLAALLIRCFAIWANIY